MLNFLIIEKIECFFSLTSLSNTFRSRIHSTTFTFNSSLFEIVASPYSARLLTGPRKSQNLSRNVLTFIGDGTGIFVCLVVVFKLNKLFSSYLFQVENAVTEEGLF